MIKIFQLKLESPEDSVSLMFTGEDTKSREEFMNAIRLYLIDFIDSEKVRMESLSHIFATIEFDEDELIKFDVHMSNFGFPRIKPDEIINGDCWTRIGKNKNGFTLSPFCGGRNDFDNYLLENGFMRKTESRELFRLF